MQQGWDRKVPSMTLMTQTVLKKVKPTHKKESNFLNPVAKFDEQITSNVLDNAGEELEIKKEIPSMTLMHQADPISYVPN